MTDRMGECEENLLTVKANSKCIRRPQPTDQSTTGGPGVLTDYVVPECLLHLVELYIVNLFNA